MRLYILHKGFSPNRFSLNLSAIIFLFSLSFCFVIFSSVSIGQDSAAPEAAEKMELLQDEMRKLVRKLGDDNYIVRQRAEEQLLRIGMKAFGELRNALKSEDTEIVSRAARILEQLNLLHQNRENEGVRIVVDTYAVEQNIGQKAKCIQLLASPDPYFGYPNGEGLQTLCRIVQFEQENSLRAEAAKALIASPPYAPVKRMKWYRSLIQQFVDYGDDDLLRLIYDYASLRCDVDELKTAAENKAKERARQNGTVPDYPVPLQPVDAMLERVRLLIDHMARFQSDPKNEAGPQGSWLDILLFYALAEIQNDLGLHEQCEQTRKAALALRKKEEKPDPDQIPIDPLDGSRPFNDHFYVGQILFERHRYLWSKDHYKIVCDEGEISHRRDSWSMIANLEQLLDHLDDAISALDHNLEILNQEDYKQKHGDSKDQKRKIEARRFYFLAQQAADRDDWQKAKENVDQVVQRDRNEIDTLILRYEILKRMPEIDKDDPNRMKNLIEGAIGQVEQQMRNGIEPQVVCNQVAWLLSNTGGDYSLATALINVTMKLEPDSPVYLDTQAHVFALGKKYQKAVEVQAEAIRHAPEAGVFRKSLERFQRLAAEAASEEL